MILLLLVYVLKNEEKFDYRFLVSKDSYGLNFKIWVDLKIENKNKKF